MFVVECVSKGRCNEESVEGDDEFAEASDITQQSCYNGSNMGRNYRMYNKARTSPN